MQNEIKLMVEESIETKKMCKVLAPKIEDAAKQIIAALKNNKKILLAGNGGSSSMSSHIAAEFVGRYKTERRGLPAIALTADLAAITAIGNDYGFETIFERQIEALANPGDIFIVLSTSGNSKNLVKAVEAAKRLDVRTIGLFGKDGGKLKNTSSVEIIVPSDNTPRIQEAHLMILHIICELVDTELFGE